MVLIAYRILAGKIQEIESIDSTISFRKEKYLKIL
jgi:hypothetical protein